MGTMAISKFKATCPALMEKVKRTEKPVLVTRKGQPVPYLIMIVSLQQPG